MNQLMSTGTDHAIYHPSAPNCSRADKTKVHFLKICVIKSFAAISYTAISCSCLSAWKNVNLTMTARN